jgi:Tfp pilus assembly protein PilV
MARRKRRSQGGFTLVEVLVSLILSMIAMVGVIALYRSQTNASSFSRRSGEATMLAEDQLEKLRTRPSGPTTGTASGLDETGKAGGIFTRTFEITQPSLNYDEIKVIVSWTEEGVTKSVTVFGRRNL